MGSFESKHNYIMLLSLFKLSTCFGPLHWPIFRSQYDQVQRPKHVVNLNKDNNIR